MFEVVLYQPEIPTNTGNVSRLCAASRCRLTLIEPIGFSLDHRQLKRAGLDYWQQLEVRVASDLNQVTHERRCVYITKFGSRPIWQHQFKSNDLLVFGRETTGLPENIRYQNSDACYYLPMPGNIRSINLANSVSAVVYEGLRQLSQLDPKLSQAPLAADKTDDTFVLEYLKPQATVPSKGSIKPA